MKGSLLSDRLVPLTLERMARRKERLSDSLILAPWWISVILAAVAYVGLSRVLPGILAEKPATRAIASMASGLAQPVCGLLLFLSFISWIRARMKARLLDEQKNIDSIRTLHWKEFEDLVAEYHRRKGYQVQENLGGGADDGIDLTLRKGKEKTVVQCKRWGRKPVPVQIIRELFGVMTAEQAGNGVLITTSTFTAEASRFAEGKRIELIPGDQLLGLIRSVHGFHRIPNPGASVKAAPASDGLPGCPECGKPMVRRTARRGSSAGKDFYGCSSYPDCRGTRAVV